jgi:hypothetical protein
MVSATHLPAVVIFGASPHGHFFWAWIALTLALALHVGDEAATGFLAIYNPSVTALRARRPWLPLPVFSFGVWLAGLLAAVVLLLGLSIFAWRGAAWMRPLGYIFAFIMLANGAAHIAGTIAGRTIASIRFPRPMPGFYSSPFVLLASAYLLCRL